MNRAGQERTEKNKRFKKSRKSPRNKDWPLFMGNKSFLTGNQNELNDFKKV